MVLLWITISLKAIELFWRQRSLCWDFWPLDATVDPPEVGRWAVICRKSTSLLCLRRSFQFFTSKMPYGWQRKAYILDLASISRYIFASMDFRISFSRNEWLSFSAQQSTHGTHRLSTRSFFSCISLNNCRELHAILNPLKFSRQSSFLPVFYYLFPLGSDL